MGEQLIALRQSKAAVDVEDLIQFAHKITYTTGFIDGIKTMAPYPEETVMQKGRLMEGMFRWISEAGDAAHSRRFSLFEAASPGIPFSGDIPMDIDMKVRFNFSVALDVHLILFCLHGKGGQPAKAASRTVIPYRRYPIHIQCPEYLRPSGKR
jgi:hypothetical protein